MTHEVVTLKLPRELLSEAQTLAQNRGLTVGEMVRQFLADETDTDAPSNAEHRRARLARHLLPVFAAATSWQSLTDALSDRGYTLRPQGAGLAIYKIRDGKHFCNTATVGHRYRKLVNRFGAPMPGHPHGSEVLSSPPISNPQNDSMEPVREAGAKLYPVA